MKVDPSRGTGARSSRGQPPIAELLCGLLVLGLAACGDDAAGDLADASPPALADAQGDAATATCETAKQTLSAELYEVLGACTVALRFDYESKAALGHQVFCGEYKATTARVASEQAEADIGYGTMGTVLNGSNSDGPYLFYAAPGDFGWAAAVDRNTGLSVFGGSIIWLGTGDISYPSAWREPAELPSGCTSSGNYTVTQGWDLRDGSALPSTDVDELLAKVSDTVLVDAFYTGGYLFDASVLLYPRAVGAFDPSQAEWVVLLSGGWLD